MLEFSRVWTVVHVAFAMQDAIAQANRDVQPSRRLRLRIGIERGVVADAEREINGVIAGDDPLAARLVSEACAAMTLRELQRSQGKAPQSLRGRAQLKITGVALDRREARYSTAPTVQRSAFRGLPR